MRLARTVLLVLAAAFTAAAGVRGDDGYRLWLRYDRIAESSLRQQYIDATATIVLRTGVHSGR